MLTYYNRIKDVQNKETAIGDSWMRMYLSNDLSHNPNALDGMKPPRTFYKVLGYRILDWAYGTCELFDEKPNIEKIVSYRNILFDADDQEEIADAYTQIAQLLYTFLDVRDPEVLDPKRHLHFQLYVERMISEMYKTGKYDVSVISEDDKQYVEYAIAVVRAYHRERKPCMPMFIPLEDIKYRLPSFSFNAMYTLMSIYKNSPEEIPSSEQITFEDVAKTGKPELIGPYLANCKQIPTVEQLSLIRGQLANVVFRGIPSMRRMKELIETFLNAYPDEPTDDFITNYIQHCVKDMRNLLMKKDLELAISTSNTYHSVPDFLMPYVKYTTNESTNAECPICRSDFSPVIERYKFSCGHAVCKECFSQYRKLWCPYQCKLE